MGLIDVDRQLWDENVLSRLVAWAEWGLSKVNGVLLRDTNEDCMRVRVFHRIKVQTSLVLQSPGEQLREGQLRDFRKHWETEQAKGLPKTMFKHALLSSIPSMVKKAKSKSKRRRETLDWKAH